MAELGPSYIVGIGGSAGGLQAYMALMDRLHPSTGMAFVIISHMVPTASSQLASIMARHTKMPVAVAAQGMLMRPNHVYVTPPDTDLFVEGHAFKVVTPRVRRNNQVDLFFTSIAEGMGRRAIGIVMSGFGGDGAEGVMQIKAKGGTTFAQDQSAQLEGMPLSAQATGCVDFVLPPDKMADVLQDLGRTTRTSP